MTDEELIAAYLDGVSELTPDERHRVEALLPAQRELADGMKRTLDTLRALSSEGSRHEPDWTALEQSIRAAVGPTMPAIPWWRRLRWVAPIGAALVTAAVALVLFHHPHEAAHAPIDAMPAAARDQPEATALYLDGQIVEIEDVDPTVLLDDDGGGDALATGGLLPAGDLGWIDTLDDSALDRAEHWLDGKKKG